MDISLFSILFKCPSIEIEWWNDRILKLKIAQRIYLTVILLYHFRINLDLALIAVWNLTTATLTSSQTIGCRKMLSKVLPINPGAWCQESVLRGHKRHRCCSDITIHNPIRGSCRRNCALGCCTLLRKFSSWYLSCAWQSWCTACYWNHCAGFITSWCCNI